MERLLIRKIEGFLITSQLPILTILLAVSLGYASYITYRRVTYVIPTFFKGFYIYILKLYQGKLVQLKVLDYRLLLILCIFLTLATIMLEFFKIRNDKYRLSRIILLVAAVILDIIFSIVPELNPVSLGIIIILITYSGYLTFSNKSVYEKIVEYGVYILIPYAIMYIIEILLISLHYTTYAYILSLINDFSVFLALTFVVLSILRIINVRKYTNEIREVFHIESLEKYWIHLYIIGILCSIVIAIVPFLPQLNPRQIPISVDTYYYYIALKAMDKYGLMYAYIHDIYLRPIYLTILYVVHKFFNISIWDISTYHIIPLLILLTIFSYVFMHGITSRKGIAAFSSFLCCISVVYMTFLYGGFHANILSLCILFTCIILLIKTDTCRDVKFIVACIISIIDLFIHPWSWVQYNACILAYCIYQYVSKNVNRFKILRNYLIIVSIAALLRFTYHLRSIRSVIAPAIFPILYKGATISHSIFLQFNLIVWGTMSLFVYYLVCIFSLFLMIARGCKLSILDFLLLVSIIPAFSSPLRVVLDVVPYIYATFYISYLIGSGKRLYRFCGIIIILAFVTYSVYMCLMSIPSTSSVPWNVPKTA